MASKRGKTIKGEAREIVASVLSVCDEEAEINVLNYQLLELLLGLLCILGLAKEQYAQLERKMKKKQKQSRKTFTLAWHETSPPLYH